MTIFDTIRVWKLRNAMRTQNIMNLFVFSAVVGLSFAAFLLTAETAGATLLGFVFMAVTIYGSVYAFHCPEWNGVEGKYTRTWSDEVAEILTAKRGKQDMMTLTAAIFVVAVFVTVYLQYFRMLGLIILSAGAFFVACEDENEENLSVSLIIGRNFEHKALSGGLFPFIISVITLVTFAFVGATKDLTIAMYLPSAIVLAGMILVTFEEGMDVLSSVGSFFVKCTDAVAEHVSVRSVAKIAVVVTLGILATGCGATLTSTVEVTHAETKAFDCYKTQEINGKTFLLAGKTGQNSLRIADTGDKIAKKMAVKGYSCVPTHVVVPMAEVECGSLLAQVIGGRCVIK